MPRVLEDVYAFRLRWFGLRAREVTYTKQMLGLLFCACSSSSSAGLQCWREDPGVSAACALTRIRYQLCSLRVHTQLAFPLCAYLFMIDQGAFLCNSFGTFEKAASIWLFARVKSLVWNQSKLRGKPPWTSGADARKWFLACVHSLMMAQGANLANASCTSRMLAYVGFLNCVIVVYDQTVPSAKLRAHARSLHTWGFSTVWLRWCTLCIYFRGKSVCIQDGRIQMVFRLCDFVQASSNCPLWQNFVRM